MNDDGACCSIAEARMSDDGGCTLSMTAEDERQGGRWRAHLVTISHNWLMTVTD